MIAYFKQLFLHIKHIEQNVARKLNKSATLLSYTNNNNSYFGYMAANAPHIGLKAY